jgi:hypothetical protein
MQGSHPARYKVFDAAGEVLAENRAPLAQNTDIELHTKKPRTMPGLLRDATAKSVFRNRGTTPVEMVDQFGPYGLNEFLRVEKYASRSRSAT